MSVGPVRPTGLASVAAGRARRLSGGFSLPEEAADAAASTAVAPPSSLGGLLALQDSGAAALAEPPAARARRRASQALDELRGLQLDLLGEAAADPARLDRLRNLAAMPDAASEAGLEPDLAGLLAQVRLRARLELARRFVSRPSSE